MHRNAPQRNEPESNLKKEKREEETKTNHQLVLLVVGLLFHCRGQKLGELDNTGVVLVNGLERCGDVRPVQPLRLILLFFGGGVGGAMTESAGGRHARCRSGCKTKKTEPICA